MADLLAIVGRPNVGKSALFNRIVGKRIAIVHDQPGVTRDRIMAEAEWQGRSFTLVDTGGIGLLRGQKAPDAIISAAFEQVQIAIDTATLILFVVDVREGIVSLDREVADRLRRSGKPVLVVVNKVDTSKADPGVDEFAALGFPAVFPVSAIHGVGMDALMTAAMALGAPGPTVPAEEPGETAQLAEDAGPDAPAGAVGPLKLAIIGRPNVGKSSIINTLTQSDRVIVSPVPGTTRDAVDVPFEVDTDGKRESYVLIDTAGLRKSRRVADSIEFFSVKRTEDSVARCDIAVFVLDADSGVTEQDKKIGDLVIEQRRACVIVVNKWDLVEEAVRAARLEEIARRERKERRGGPKELTTLGEFGEWVQRHLFFLDYAPVIFASAQTGFNLERLLEAVRYVAAQLRQRIPTAILNRALHDAVERRQPVSSHGHRLKFYYATQMRHSPPTFVLFVNRTDLFSDAYRRYLSDQIRKAFGFEGCPIVLVAKARPRTIAPVRKFNPRPSRQPGWAFDGSAPRKRRPNLSKRPHRGSRG